MLFDVYLRCTLLLFRMNTTYCILCIQIYADGLSFVVFCWLKARVDFTDILQEYFTDKHIIFSVPAEHHGSYMGKYATSIFQGP